MAYFPLMMTDPDLHRYIFLTHYDEKVEWAIRFLSKHEKIPAIYLETKDARIATNFIEQGNRNFPSTTWERLLETYTQAIIYAPSDSSQLALAYGNRSAALYNGGLYEDCILDVERALSVGYPNKLKAKLYARKARCLYALNNDKMSSGVDEAVAECRKWHGQMNDTDKESMNIFLTKLPTNSSKKKPIREIDQRIFLPQILEGNSKIMGASSAVELKYSAKFGRHVVATRDIATGETLSMHNPYASTVGPNSLLKNCWNCSKRVRAGVPCRECITVIYCSETCRDTAWEDYHDIECRVIPTLLHENMSKLELMVLKLTSKAYKEAGSVQNLREKLAKIDRMKDPITKSYTGNSFDDTKYASVYTLSSDTGISVDISIKCVLILYCLAATTKIFGCEISNICNLLNDQSAIFMGTLMMKHFNICERNYLRTRGCGGYNKTYELGYSIYPFINQINHSCDPMACVVTAKGLRVLVAIQRIKKGQQISISHNSCFWLQPINERQNSMNRLNFECECKPCMENWGPLSPLFFPSYKDCLPPNVEKLLQRLSQKYPESYMQKIAISDIPPLISTLSQMMNIHQLVAKYPTQEIIMIKNGLITLYAYVSFMLSTD